MSRTPTAAATGGTTSSGSQPHPGRWRGEVRSLVELFALNGFALAQPLLDIFGRAPDQFVFRGADRSDIIGFALVVMLALPVALWAVEAVVGLVFPPARRWLHTAFVAALVAAFAVQVLRALFSGPGLLVAGVVVGALVAALHRRHAPVRLWLGYCAVAPPLFAVLFLFSSQTAQLIGDPDSAGVVRIGNRSPVVMVVFDELPLASLITAEGDIDAELFPNFDRLASDSHWFRNTTAISNYTWNAVPSLITGQMPVDGQTPTAGSHPESLFTLLGDTMGLKVKESITRLCPTDLCEVAVPKDGGLPGLLRDARTVMTDRLSADPPERDPVAGLVEDQAADPALDAAEEEADSTPALTIARAESFLAGLDDPTNTLHYLHVLLPHIPFRYLPSGVQYPGPTPDLGRQDDNWVDDPALVDLGRHRHLLQLAYADDLLGRTIEAMEDAGTYDDSVLLVVADHGASFRPGQPIRGLDNDRSLTDEVAAEIMWVPFFLKESGQDSPTVSDDNVLTVDVLPTLADTLDVDLPWEVDGRSALDAARSETTKVMYRANTTRSGVEVGEGYELGTDEGRRLVQARSVDRFLPAVGDPQRWWRRGPHAELVGTRVDGAADGELRPVTVTLDPAVDLSGVDPSSGRVPALVWGAVSGVEPGDPLAVAVNGTVRATVDAHRLGEGAGVAAVVSDGSFTAGTNRVEVYRITR